MMAIADTRKKQKRLREAPEVKDITEDIMSQHVAVTFRGKL